MNKRIVLFAALAVCLLVSGLASAKPKQLNAAKIDDLAQAKTVQANKSYRAVKGQAATIEAGEPAHFCHAGAVPSVWFKYKADRSFTVLFDSIGSTFPYSVNTSYDSVMSIYRLTSGAPATATYANLAASTCNNNGNGTAAAQIQMDVTAGQWYYIRVTPASTAALPDGTVFQLNVTALNLIENGDFDDATIAWKHTGSGKNDDSLTILSSGINFQFDQSALGKSKLTQKIGTFGGVKLTAGTMLVLTTETEAEGVMPDLKMKLKVVHADGTVAKRANALTVGAGMEHKDILEVEYKLQKPVAKLIVSFIVRDNGTEASIRIRNIWMEVIPKSIQTRAVALPLSLLLPTAPQA